MVKVFLPLRGSKAASDRLNDKPAGAKARARYRKSTYCHTAQTVLLQVKNWQGGKRFGYDGGDFRFRVFSPAGGAAVNARLQFLQRNLSTTS